MSDFQLQLHELKRNIEELTLQILGKISRNDIVDLAPIINRRLDLLYELIELVTTDKDKQSLIAYLNEFQARDQIITNTLKKEFNVVKNSLSNIKNLKEYTEIC